MGEFYEMKLKEKYLNEAGFNISTKVPGFKIQKACRNCKHYAGLYGGDSICTNPKFSDKFNYKEYGHAGINLKGRNEGICPSYEKNTGLIF
jgi:hypothetical protein